MATKLTAALAADAATATARRAYLTASVDTETGEVTETSRFKYLPGHPRQIRFDGKAGVFNINGDKVIGNSLTFIPVALRVFKDSLFTGSAFNKGRKVWAEMFYFDDNGILCGLLFHGYSVENLTGLNAELFYEDLNLTDVLLTVKAVKKENKKVGGTYFIAGFSYTAADPAEVAARQQFAADFDIYREETVTGEAEVHLSKNYRVPEGYEPSRPEAARLEAAEAAPAALAIGQ